jgi:hypothetical protein
VNLRAAKGRARVLNAGRASVTVAAVRTPRPLRPLAARAALRFGAIAGVAVAALGSAVLAAGPALAIGERGTPGDKMSAIETTAIFLGIPLGVAVVIAFLVFLPSIVSGPRYRPGRPWTATASWFGDPIGSETAAAAITTLPPATLDGGGASARW